MSNPEASSGGGDPNPSGHKNGTYRYYVLSAGLLLVLSVCSVLLGVAYKQDGLIREQVRQKADALFEGIVLTRLWNADHGGAYVLKKPGMESNPYLESPDITDTEGNVYTLKNPALMTREISEYAERGGKFRFHITSLNLKNPDNEPDAWERKALESFNDGVTEVAEVVREEGGAYNFRLMRPLYAQEPCLVCHDAQGYMLGDVRGGISVTLPFDDAGRAIQSNFYTMEVTAAVLIIIFALVMYLFVWRLMKQLEQQKAQLEELNATKDLFMRIAAHDLRNPLLVISGYADLLGERYKGEKDAEIINLIRSNADKMINLINNLLDVSKLRQGTMLLRKSEVDVARFLGECAAHNEMLGGMKGVKLVTDLPEEGCMALLDREHMTQAIDNLLGNAFKFSHKDSSVTLGARAEGAELVIWVSDAGVGIPGEELDKIFGEFVKGASRPTGNETSTGLGLAIVKRVVELHGGTVSVTSEVDKGSTFTIRMPLK